MDEKAVLTEDMTKARRIASLACGVAARAIDAARLDELRKRYPETAWYFRIAAEDSERFDDVLDMAMSRLSEEQIKKVPKMAAGILEGKVAGVAADWKYQSYTKLESGYVREIGAYFVRRSAFKILQSRGKDDFMR